MSDCATNRMRLHQEEEALALEAVFYIVCSGCAWRLLPHDFPPWKTVYYYFRLWRIDGTWEKLNAAIRKCLWVRLGREPQPSAGIVDSRSAKSTGVGGEEERGYDGGKQIKGKNAISLLIQRVSCSRRGSMWPTSSTATG